MRVLLSRYWNAERVCRSSLHTITLMDKLMTLSFQLRKEFS
jgi:hypothetical protein